MSLYLASQSPRRRELLQQIGVDFTLLPTEVDESPQALFDGDKLIKTESAEELVCRLAALKALTGSEQIGDATWPVLGADTVVCIDGEILGKPVDINHSAAMLRQLSGRTHQVLSAVSFCQGRRQQTELSITDVSFRDIDATEIADYGLTGEAMGKAGGYAIQGLAGLFVTRIEGSYSGVVGLPLEKLFPLLQAFNVPYWRQL